MRYQKLIRSALVAGACFSAVAAFGQSAPESQTQSLLDLLVKKGVITEQDAENLQQQVSAPASAQANLPPPPAGTAAGSPGALAAGTPDSSSPLYFRIGNATFTPLGFMDFTTVYRSVNTNGAIGTGFGTIPYSNAAGSQLSETRFSAQNSRLGLKIDSNVGDTKVLGYVETDFLGNAPSNLNQTSNSDVLRMRVYFADLQRGPWEFLAGQDWSLLTPNRTGISPMPSDVFYTMDMDTNYQVGLVWARQPQVRLVYHADDSLAFGISAEEPDQFTGSALGNGAATGTPTGFNTASVDNGSQSPSSPNEIPDIIAKMAYDGKVGDMPFHAEVAGLYRYFDVNTFAVNGSNVPTVNSTANASGYGGSLNLSFKPVPTLNLIAQGFMSNGGGRYISTGLAPDFVVRPPDASGNDTISTVHSSSALFGAEWQAIPTDTIFAYYGLVDARANYVPSGTSFVGYGYNAGTAAVDQAQNKSIDEYTLGDVWTLWKSPTHGALQIISQLSYLDRTPFFVAPNTEKNAKTTMAFVDMRYVLP